MPRNELSTESYVIKAVQSSDIEQIRQWRNMQIRLLRQTSPLAEADQKAYFEQEIWPSMRLKKPDQILLGFHKSKAMIGYGGLVHIDWLSSKAEVSFLLEPSRGSSETTYKEDFCRFLDLIKILAFDDLGLRRLYTESYTSRSNHDVHEHALTASGFHLEGTLKDHTRFDGQYFDAVVHGLITPFRDQSKSV